MSDSSNALTESKVQDWMTAPAVTILPDQSARAAAEIMLRLKISGLPVVDAHGKPLGVVSEGDFQFSDAATRKRQRENWVKILSGGQDMAKDYLEALEREAEGVQQIMARPAICIDADARIGDAAELMRERRIKRLVVLRDGRVAGVLTRADILKFFAPAAAEPARPVTPEFFESALAARLRKPQKPEASPPAAPGVVSAVELKKLVEEFERKKSSVHDDARRVAEEKRAEQVKLLLNSRFTDAELSHIMMLAREAARRGETGVPALVFPAALCTDGGRAINLPDPDWPATLRGKAADFFLRWEKDLKPQGFALTARMVSFPDGFPGDAELALVWGS